MTWHVDKLTHLQDKVAIVTGGNAGLGWESVSRLASAGATVVLACRNQAQGESLAAKFNETLKSPRIIVLPLDLINPDSIQQFVKKFKARFFRLDILINNGGVVNLEKLTHTDAGHEMHMATNHLGHFLLTNLLFDVLVNTDDSRVVTVSSGGYRAGKIDFDDIAWHKRQYSRVKAYGDSKLANLLFMLSLQKRFDDIGCSSKSVAAHPGLTATKRQQTIGVGGRFAKCLAAPLDVGVAPQLYAATASDVNACDFYGPRFGIRGKPALATLKGHASDLALAEQLWAYSEQETGLTTGSD